jgi:hypothetical protein
MKVFDPLAEESAPIVVKRGPNTGSRFLLDQPAATRSLSAPALSGIVCLFGGE